MLVVYTLEQSEQWDAVVRSFSDYDVYWLSGYAKSFKIHGDGEPLLFYYEKEQTRGINVVMKRDVALDKHFKGNLEYNKYFDFSTPYGYGGWLIEGENKDGLFSEYESWCQKNGIICEFVRFHPVLKNHQFSSGVYDVVQLGNTVALDLSSPEVIWENIISKNRNMIRKVEKNGIEIHHRKDLTLFENFRRMYNATMDKDHAEEYYFFEEKFYECIHNDLYDNYELFYAVLNGEIIAMSIILFGNTQMHYHLSGSVLEYRSLAPTNLLLYKAALWGSEQGYRTFHLGGGVGAGEDNLYKFKAAFNKNSDYQFSIGKQIFNEEKYKELVKIRRKEDLTFDETSKFFPLYRS